MRGIINFLEGVLPRGLFRRGLVIVAAFLALLLSSARFFYQLGSPDAPLCFMNGLTGLYCPFCGSTRAFQNAFGGDFSAALKMNSAVLVLIPLSFLLWAFFRKKKAGGMWVFMAAILFLFGVLRNIPLWPFDLLAPR